MSNNAGTLSIFDEAPGKPRLNLKNKNASIYIIFFFLNFWVLSRVIKIFV